MKKQNSKPEVASSLRQKAEEQLKLHRDVAYNISANSTSEPDLLKLIHELEVHQIELEMQNEELVIAKEKAELAEEKYTHLYDFAPSGYMALSKNGEILELNFAAAQMLGKERSHLIKKRFEFFVSIDTQTTFNLFLLDVFSSKVKLSCEVIIETEGNLPIYVNINGNVSQNRELCLLTVVDITERKQIEEKLIRSENELKKAQQITHIGSWYLDVATNKVDWTEELYKMYGFDPELPVPPYTEHQKLFTPESWELLSASLAHTAETGIPYELELKTVKHDGSNGWMWVRGETVTDNTGKTVGLWGAAQDITTRKEMEEAVRKSNERFKGIFNNLQDAFFQADLWGNFTLISPSALSMYGYQSFDELIGMPAAKLYADASVRENVLKELTENGGIIKDFITQAKRKDGSTFWVSMNVQFAYQNGKISGTEGVVRDITERRQAEEKIKESEEKFKSLMQQSPFVVELYDLNGLQISVNKSYEELWDFPAETTLNKFNVLESKEVEETGLLEYVKRAYAGNSVDVPEYIFDPSGDTEAKGVGRSRWLNTRIYPLKDESGKVKNIVIVHQDITERKLAELELITAKLHAEESDHLKSAFLANMSHEIRTPMNGILGFSELLKNPKLTGEQQQEYIQIIGKSGARMLNIINDIVDISKIEAGQMKVDIKDCNINDKIEFIYLFFKPQVEEKGMKLLFKNTLPAKVAIIRTDNEKVYSILTNLVKNAIKYSKEGTIEFGYLKKGETLEFYVTDTGIGIPKDRQSAIFERFIQADISDKMARQGAGLGLSISKAYVEMLGGKIWVESEEGIGSTFYFTLPYNEVSAEKNVVGKIVPAHDEKTQIKKLKILIAEDDETSEMLITIEVVKFSKEILKASNGFEAVEVCRNNPDTDLILMDIQMPEMNGYEATRQIRQFNKDVVIIAQTAFGLSGDREKSIEAGCNDYIAKPIKKDELLVLIQKYFKK